MGFTPCKAEPDIWLRSNGKVYEYVAVSVDDLATAVDDPEAFPRILTDTLKLKGSVPVTFYLGMDFFRDQDGILCLAPRKYLDKIFTNY